MEDILERQEQADSAHIYAPSSSEAFPPSVKRLESVQLDVSSKFEYVEHAQAALASVNSLVEQVETAKARALDHAEALSSYIRSKYGGTDEEGINEFREEGQTLLAKLPLLFNSHTHCYISTPGASGIMPAKTKKDTNLQQQYPTIDLVRQKGMLVSHTQDPTGFGQTYSEDAPTGSRFSLTPELMEEEVRNLHRRRLMQLKLHGILDDFIEGQQGIPGSSNLSRMGLRDLIELHARVTGDESIITDTPDWSACGRLSRFTRVSLARMWIHHVCPFFARGAWSEEESAALMQAYSAQSTKNPSNTGNTPDWSQIAHSIAVSCNTLPRTDYDCFMKYASFMNNTVGFNSQAAGFPKSGGTLLSSGANSGAKFGKWSYQELQRLQKGVAMHGSDWYGVSSVVGSRSASACLQRAQIRPLNGAWTEEEVTILKEAVACLQTLGTTSASGNAFWKTISLMVRTRDPLQCKAKWASFRSDVRNDTNSSVEYDHGSQNAEHGTDSQAQRTLIDTVLRKRQASEHISFSDIAKELDMPGWDARKCMDAIAAYDRTHFTEDYGEHVCIHSPSQSMMFKGIGGVHTGFIAAPPSTKACMGLSAVLDGLAIKRASKLRRDKRKQLKRQRSETQNDAVQARERAGHAVGSISCAAAEQNISNVEHGERADMAVLPRQAAEQDPPPCETNEKNLGYEEFKELFGWAMLLHFATHLVKGKYPRKLIECMKQSLTEYGSTGCRTKPAEALTGDFFASDSGNMPGQDNHGAFVAGQMDKIPLENALSGLLLFLQRKRKDWANMMTAGKNSVSAVELDHFSDEGGSD